MAGVGGPAPARGDAEPSQSVRVLAFCDLESGLWGAAWIPPGGAAIGVVGVGSEAGARQVTLEGSDPSGTWRLRGEGIELDWEGVSEAVLREIGAPEEGFDQMCHVSGTAPGGRGLPCLGWRSTQPDPGKMSSLRQAAAWFEPGEGFAVLALRPTKAKGQDQDAMFAAQFGRHHAAQVIDPRLSTTYLGSGQAGRAGVELWTEASEESEHLYPHRAVGEAIQAPVQWEAGGLALEAQPFRWYSAGREGGGIYLLGRCS